MHSGKRWSRERQLGPATLQHRTSLPDPRTAACEGVLQNRGEHCGSTAQFSSTKVDTKTTKPRRVARTFLSTRSWKSPRRFIGCSTRSVRRTTQDFWEERAPYLRAARREVSAQSWMFADTAPVSGDNPTNTRHCLRGSDAVLGSVSNCRVAYPTLSIATTDVAEAGCVNDERLVGLSAVTPANPPATPSK
jgi:hypothetical protein